MGRFRQIGALVGTAAWNETLRIWEAQTGKQKFRFETNNQNWVAEFSLDSSMFAATCGDGSIRVYSLEDGSELLRLIHGECYWRTLEWSPDNKSLATGGGSWAS